jgi:hypothetical protein
MKKAKAATLPLAEQSLRRHFGKVALENLVTASRTFPLAARVDVQLSLEKLFSERQHRLLGAHTQYHHETMTIAHLMGNQHYPVVIGPLQHEEIDIGETMPARVLRHGLWLGVEDRTPYVILMSQAVRFTQREGTHIEIAVPPGEKGLALSRQLLDRIESLVKGTASYRGKVISLEASDRYSGGIGDLRVHKLRSVRREDVILPQKTLELLDRNVAEVIRHREQLRKLGMPLKKGLLFYGPPGTGKTHTIHYLASQLPGHTTLLITAEQVALLDHYFQLARFLQPAMVVVEDVDLIARARDEMRSACEESLLNKLLNEMDGLREDAEVLFVLTTNRPDHLESALASRPGRVDQAIEFPLPDENGRRQLIRLYACGLKLDSNVIDLTVSKTKGASAAFIKELMRRAAQFYLQNGGDGHLQPKQLDSALEDILLGGGSLNVKLLGGANIVRETVH